MKINKINQNLIFKNTAVNTNKTVSKPVFKAAKQPNSNGDCYISGVTKDFFEIAFSKIEPDEEMRNNLIKTYIEPNGKFSPSNALIFLKILSTVIDNEENLIRAKILKSDKNSTVKTNDIERERVISETVNMERQTTNDLAVVVASSAFEAAYNSSSKKFNFKNLSENLPILYDVAKNHGDALYEFVLSSRDKNDNFDPKIAKEVLDFMNATGKDGPLNLRIYLDNFCRDDDFKIIDENLQNTIELINLAGNFLPDRYIEIIYNKEKKQFNEDGLNAIKEILSYINSDECAKTVNRVLEEKIYNFVLVLLYNSRNEDKSFNAEFFESILQDLKMQSGDDFDKMYDLLINSDDDDNDYDDNDDIDL